MDYYEELEKILERKKRLLDKLQKHTLWQIEVGWEDAKQNFRKLGLLSGISKRLIAYNKKLYVIVNALPSSETIKENLDSQEHCLNYLEGRTRTLLRFWTGGGWEEKIRGADLTEFNRETKNLISSLNSEIKLVKELESMKEKTTKYIKADLHFHPALPKSDSGAFRKAKAFWKKIRELGLDLIAVTEHSNENPLRAFDFMVKTRPHDLNTIVLPGMEVESIEGAHIVVIGGFDYYKQYTKYFAESGKEYPFETLINIYNIPELQTWRTLKLEQIIRVARGKGLSCFIAHPYQPGTGAIDGIGRSELENIVQRNVVGISAHIGAWEQARPFLEKTGLIKYEKRIMGFIGKLLPGIAVNKAGISFSERLEMLKKTPESLTKPANFLVAESDAHTPGMMGSYIKIPVMSNNFEDIFKAVTTNTATEVVTNVKINRESIFGLLLQFFSTTEDTLKVIAHYRIRKKRSIDKVTKKMLAIMRNPKLDIEELVKVQGKTPGSNVLLTAWKKLTKKERKNLLEIVKKRLSLKI